MCGLNGVYAFNHSANLPSREELIATRDHMQARGPDGCGEWWNGDKRLGLGHRRLAIVDLSDRAAQPMRSDCGRFVLVFNGEIYNHQILRSDLEKQGAVFRTGSDTEVLLHLYARKGSAMVHDLRGMFAFAIWDDLASSLFLARDPYGIKPLYTSNDGWTFRFASQVKALLAGGQISRVHEPAGTVGFLLLGSVPEPFTLYRDIRQLPAGHTQLIDALGPREPRPYCSIAQIIGDGEQRPVRLQEVQNRVSAALLDSVRAHLVADVDIGLFLSSGIDSGALLGLTRDAGHSQIRTISLSFSEYVGTDQDEGPLAQSVSELYGSHHTKRLFGRHDFAAAFPEVMAAMDQPTIDGINMWFVAKAAREAGLKVALSGLGGDELFAGYPSFSDIPRAVRALALPSRIPFAGLAWRHAIRLSKLGRQRPKLQGLLEYGGSYPGAYLLRRGLLLPFELDTILDYDTLNTGLSRLDLLGLIRRSIAPVPNAAVARVSALESANYMRNQLLRDADWAGMAHGVEVRTPFVDVELLRAVSPALPHIRYSDRKMYVANAPQVPLPPAIAGRKKLGFTVPTQRWTTEDGVAQGATMGMASRQWALQILGNFHNHASSTGVKNANDGRLSTGFVPEEFLPA